MLTYPQLASGAVGQYPIRKTRRFRTVDNTANDGSYTKFPDAGAAVTEWELNYAGLTDDELGALLSFFESVEGSLTGFTFLDPTSNLLAWAEDLDRTVWQKAPLLTVHAGSGDPWGGTTGWQVSNTGNGPQAVRQTLEAPARFQYCWSVYTRAAQPAGLSLIGAGTRRAFQAGDGWTRLVLPCGGATADVTTFELELPGGGSVEVAGLQVDGQPGASTYRPGGAGGGIYADTHFQDDDFRYTTTDVNRHSCKVKLIHGVDLRT